MRLKQGLRQTAVFFLIVIISLTLGCDETFNPSAPFVPRMVVYSALSTQTDTQYVRIYSSYNSEDNHPENNLEEFPLTDAIVRITDGVTTFVFRDTTIARSDTSRYNSMIHVYYCYPMRVESNKQYTLEAISATHGSITANIVVPQESYTSIISSQILNAPLNFSNTDITVNYFLSSITGGFLIRFYIVFTADNPWEPEGERGKEKYFEVPARRILLDPSYQECQIYYPTVRGRGTTQTGHSSQGQLPAAFFFRNKAYRESIVRIQQSHFNIKFRRAVFFVVQFDRPWYIHYAKANLPENKYGVRLDEPYYTNITGGVGVFGSIRIDSAVVALQESISAFNPFESPQLALCQQETPPAPEPLNDLRKLMFRP